MDSDSGLAIGLYCILGFVTLSSCFIGCRRLGGSRANRLPLLGTPTHPPDVDHPFFRL